MDFCFALAKQSKHFKLVLTMGSTFTLYLGHQREQGDIASKDLGKAHFLSGMQNA